MTHKIPVDISNSSVYSSLTLLEQHNTVRQLRSDLLHRSRSIILQSPSPIRVMARMVAE
jgi:hypothetical protein